MSERDELLSSIANTIGDYRTGELPPPSPKHVDRWIHQFEQAVQLPMLREINRVFELTYFPKSGVGGFLEKLVVDGKLTGDNPAQFWRECTILEIQQNGHSQRAMRKLLGESIKTQIGLEIEQCGPSGQSFIYLDDVLFSGSRIGLDLEAWIVDSVPASAIVHIAVIATHSYGEWTSKERLKKAATAAGKKLEFIWWAGLHIENRVSFRNTSEVLWPADIPNDALLLAYIEAEQKYPFQPRQAGGKLKNAIFSSEDGRQLLERELLLAGLRIRSFCQRPRPSLRPLGFSRFGLGFGSTIATFHNCPNTCPLALWWGDPSAAPGHPLRKWYPLLPRKTYEP